MTAVLNQWSEHCGGPGGHSFRAISGKQASAIPGPPGPANILMEWPAMIYHHNRITFRAGVTAEQREEGLEYLRAQGRIDAVKSFVVGKEVGGDYSWGAVFVIE